MPARLGEKRRCERCGTDIVFLKHERTGQLAPIELSPHPQGRFQVNWEDNTYRTVAGKSKDGSSFSQRKHDGVYHENHYVACPSSQFFRNLRDRTQATEEASA